MADEQPKTPVLRAGAPSRASRRRWAVLLPMLYVAAAVLIGRGAVTQNDTLFPLDDYAHGHAPLPFQARYAMVPILRWAGQSAGMAKLAHTLRNSSRGPEELAVQLVDAACLIACGLLVLSLRRRFTTIPVRLPWLAPMLLLWIVALTFTVRYEQRLFMPYDFLSILLFLAGVLACLDRRWWLFLALMLLATYNRETTIFLVPVWLVCTWTPIRRRQAATLAIAAVGVLLWALVRHQVHGWVGGGAGSGLMVDLKRNLTLLLPHHLPQVISAGGYLALPMLLRRDLVRDRRLRRLWGALLLFLVSDLAFGLWNETRIFAEISPLIAVTAAIQVEEWLRDEASAGSGQE